MHCIIIIRFQGRIQDFHGGGGHKRLCVSTYITSAEPNSLLAGVQVPQKGPGRSRVVLMGNMSLIFEYLINNWIKNIVHQILGRGCLLRPPWIRHCIFVSIIHTRQKHIFMSTIYAYTFETRGGKMQFNVKLSKDRQNENINLAYLEYYGNNISYMQSDYIYFFHEEFKFKHINKQNT